VRLCFDCSHETTCEGSERVATSASCAATHQRAEHGLHTVGLLDSLLEVLLTDGVDLIVKRGVALQLNCVVHICHLFDEFELFELDALDEHINEVKHWRQGLLLEVGADFARFRQLLRLDEHFDTCARNEEVLLRGIRRLHHVFHCDTDLVLIPRLEEVFVGAGVKTLVAVADAEDLGKLPPPIVRVTDNALEHSLASFRLTMLHGVGAKLNKVVINGAEIFHFFHMLDEVDLQDVHNQIFLAGVG